MPDTAGRPGDVIRETVTPGTLTPAKAMRNRRSLIVAAVFALTGLSAHSQTTKDPGTRSPDIAVRAPKHASDSLHHQDTTRVHYTYTGAGTINDANTLHSFVLSNALKFSLAKKSAELNLNNAWLYGRQNGLLTNNDISSAVDVGLYKTLRHFYYWGLAAYNHSVPLQILQQFQTGAGPGYDFIDKKTAIAGLSDGILYEVNDLYDSLYRPIGGNLFRRDRYQTFRHSVHLLVHWVIVDHFTIDGSGFLQNSLSDWSDYILRLNASAAVKLYKWIQFTANAAYSRFTRTRGRDLVIGFGVGIQR